MAKYELSFATIEILQEDIAEVIVHEGVEIDLNMVNEYHDFLLSHMKKPFAVLVNKVKQYTYNFQAQMEIGKLQELHALAIVVYNTVSERSSLYLTDLSKPKGWNAKVFHEREIALEWLKSQQNEQSANL